MKFHSLVGDLNWTNGLAFGNVVNRLLQENEVDPARMGRVTKPANSIGNAYWNQSLLRATSDKDANKITEEYENSKPND